MLLLLQLACAAAAAAPQGQRHLPLPPHVEATGRFTLHRHESAGWALHRPDGSPTFLLALNHLANPFFYDVIEGASGLGPCHPWDYLCLQHDLLHTKYHGDWALATADFVKASKAMGFNSAGYEYVPAADVPWSYLPDLFITNASHIFQNSADYSPSFPDVFGAAFNATTDARVRDWCATDQHIGHPRVLEQVVGYYFEDQGLWNVSAARSAAAATNSSGPTDWSDAMRTLPADAPGKAAYVTWLEQRYQSRGGLAAARRVYALPSSVRSWGDVRGWGFATLDAFSIDVLADDNEFLGVVAEQLFDVAASAVRRHDPGALVFGQRFLGNDTPPPVLAAAGRHFDAISVQPSPFSFSDDGEAAASAANLARISALAGGRPVFVADQTTHFQVPPGQLGPSCWEDKAGKLHFCARNATGAGNLYRDYLAELRAEPSVIGYSHCQVRRCRTEARRKQQRLTRLRCAAVHQPRGVPGLVQRPAPHAVRSAGHARR